MLSMTNSSISGASAIKGFRFHFFFIVSSAIQDSRYLVYFDSREGKKGIKFYDME